MKAIKSLVVAVALTAAGVAIGADAQAATHGGWSGHTGGGHWSGGHFTGGGHFGHFGHAHFAGPRFGFFLGAPIFWPGWYWGYPYYYDWYYPRAVYVEPAYPASTPDDAATTVAPSAPGAPPQAPAYLNYCESAKAYYPKVTSCPEGWKFLPSAPAR